MEWLPTVSAEVLNVAVLPSPRGLVPIVVPPSLNVTVPVGVPVPLVTLTVAVNVTSCPDVLYPCLTFCVSEADPLPLKLLSPA